MPVERAGYTVTMFVIDISASMGNIREVEVDNPDGTTRIIEMTNLQWCLQYVKLKIRDMIYNGRKTDQCGVIVVGSEETRNIVNDEHREHYRNIIEYIPIAQPDSKTIAKVDALRPSTTAGDGTQSLFSSGIPRLTRRAVFDALVVAAAVQQRYLNTKKTWTRKIILVTDGESPMELTDTEGTSDKLKEFGVKLTIVGVDFDDEEYPFKESNKSAMKANLDQIGNGHFAADMIYFKQKVNETFFREKFIPSLDSAFMGTCALALRESSAPEIRVVKSMMTPTVLRIGDLDARSDEAIELPIKTCKCTSISRPKSWKKYALRRRLDANGQEIDEEEEEESDGDKKAVYAPLKSRTEYLIDRNPAEEDKDGDVKMKVEDEDVKMETEDTDESVLKAATKLEQIEKEDLVKGFKYGTTYVPCPDGQFSRLPTKKGIDICGFFPSKNFRRDLAMGEIQYVWADPNAPSDQVALSSIAQAMEEKSAMAIARWVTRDGMDPKMGVLAPVIFDNVDCLIWIPMPFADDVRKYPFASLDILVNKKGEVLTEHPYLPTEEQLEAMDRFVDAMDLEDCGETVDEGYAEPWFKNNDAFNPSVHRIKQAMFHAATVEDITSYPLPPPHPETIKYFEPPKRALERARGAIEECKSVFNVKEIVKATKSKKDNHSHAQDDDDDVLLLDLKKPAVRGASQMDVVEAGPSSTHAKATVKVEDEDSVTEDEDEEELLLSNKKPSQPAHRSGPPLPTPARSVSPQVDPGREPGRIIGSTYPLKDFKQNIAQGDVVTKAVQDLSAVIAEVVMKPFASRRTGEMLECMVLLRQTCLEEDEIDAWNTFIRDLKRKCLSAPGNPSFWRKVQEHGRDLSLISKQEAKRQGGDSEVTENEAGEFIS